MSVLMVPEYKNNRLYLPKRLHDTFTLGLQDTFVLLHERQHPHSQHGYASAKKQKTTYITPLPAVDGTPLPTGAVPVTEFHKNTAIMPRDIISRSRFEAVIELIDGAYSPNTVRAYYADMKEFIEYCEELALRALPAEPDTVAAFLESRIELNLSSSFIKRKYSTISIIHQLADLPDPTRAGRVRIAMLRVYRQQGRYFKQAYGITRPMLDKMLAVTDDDLRGARDRALLLIGYDSMRRRQELTSLRFEDIEYHEDRSVVLLRKSKTDQYGTGHWIHLGEEATWAMKEWFAYS